MILNLEEASRVLQKGGVVGIPTETVYGLAASAFNEDAVLNVFRVKNRPAFDPLIVHVAPEMMRLSNLVASGLVDAEHLTAAQTKVSNAILRHGTPGPLTILFPKGNKVFDCVTSGSDFVAIRCPTHPLTQKLIRQVETPLVAPSANRFGHISPTSAWDVIKELGAHGLNGVLDGGPCEIGVESTIVSVAEDGSIAIERPGFFGRENFQSWGLNVAERRESKKVSAPGQLSSHYAPRKPCSRTFVKDIAKNDARTAFLFPIPDAAISGVNIFTLTSQHDNDLSAAKRLFRLLRELDESPNFDQISIAIPDEKTFIGPLWDAIRDRLLRATSSKI